MADWLALGLEEAFSEKPEIGIVRKHRTESGLIRYDQRRDVEWPQIAKEIIAAEKPKYIVMMVGNNDRQSIREKAPVARPAAPARLSRRRYSRHSKHNRPRRLRRGRHPRSRIRNGRLPIRKKITSRRRRPSRSVRARSAPGISTPRSGRPPISGASTPPWRP